MSVRSTAALAQIFRRFGEVEGRTVKSPLYEQFSYGVAEDPEILDLAALTPPGQPPPNLLFASVHYLLLTGVNHPLMDYYPDLSPSARSPSRAYDAFRDFCIEHRAQLERLITTRLVQTNVVRRSVCLLPAFAAVAALGDDRPLAQIEIGASAGLNLLWEHYRYDYGSGVTWGNPASPLGLSAELRGEIVLPPIPATLGAEWAVGIDLNPVEIEDDDAVMWLRALVWPENVDQQDQLLAAIQVAKEHPPRLLKGDGSELLPELLQGAPPLAALCVFATHTLPQLPADARRTLLKTMESYSASRPVYFLSMEQPGTPHSELRLTVYEGGKREIVHLANCHPHGRWLEWLDIG
jgi:hypothetical protein